MPTKGTGDNLQTSINIRVGKKFREKYTAYLDEHDVPGASFTRSALEYWMSVDGDPGSLQQELEYARKDVAHMRELLAEKERTIAILQEQIQWLNTAQGYVQVNGNKNSHITAVAEREAKNVRNEE